MMKMDPDFYVPQLKLAEEKNMTVDDSDVLKFINRDVPNDQYHIILEIARSTIHEESYIS